MIDLAAIKARCDAATEGPWEIEEPMSDERFATLGGVIGAVLRKRFGNGSAEDVDRAIKAAWPES